MNKEKFRRALHESVDRLVDKVLEQVYDPAVVYDLQLIGSKPLLSVSKGEHFQHGRQIITFGEELFELIGGDWFLQQQYRREKTT